MRSGDVILINQSASPFDRDGIYLLFVGELLRVKRLQSLPGGMIRVTSDNPAFEPWSLDQTNAGEGSDVRILGRVVWSGRKL